MNEVIRFALLGLGVGALYAFASQGLIVIYRGTGVLELLARSDRDRWRLSSVGTAVRARVAVPARCVFGVALLSVARRVDPLGDHAPAATGQFAGSGHRHARRARHRSRRASSSATAPTPARSRVGCRRSRVTLWGDVGTTADRFILLGIAMRVGVRLCGCSTAPASSASQPKRCRRASAPASAIGVSPNRIAVLNWALGSAIAAIAGILVVPIITLQVTAMTELVLAGAGGCAGRRLPFVPDRHCGRCMRSASARRIVGRFVHQQGLGPSLPFLVIIVFLVFRGRSLPHARLLPTRDADARQRSHLVGLDAVRVRRRRSS